MYFLTTAVILALIATITVLGWGLGSMAHGGSYDRQHSEQLMFARLSIQAIAFVLVVIALLYSLF